MQQQYSQQQYTDNAGMGQQPMNQGVPPEQQSMPTTPSMTGNGLVKRGVNSRGADQQNDVQMGSRDTAMHVGHLPPIRHQPQRVY